MQKYNYDYVVKKNTETVQRCNIHLTDDEVLKIETSYRMSDIDAEDIKIIKGIKTYSIDFLAELKISAYYMRDTIRDLYYIPFIINNYWDSLSKDRKKSFRIALMNKGLEQYDFLISQQTDNLVDKDKLLDDFCRAYDKLGIKSDYEIMNSAE